MNVIPQAQPINFDDDMEVSVKERFQSQETKINVGNGITKRPVGGTKKDFFVRNAEEPKAPPKVVEQPEAEASQPPQQQNFTKQSDSEVRQSRSSTTSTFQVEPQAKAKKPKRKCTPAQLAALARAREKRNAKMAEKRKKRKIYRRKIPNSRRSKPSNRTTSRPVNNGTN